MKKFFLPLALAISILLMVVPASAWISGYDQRDTIHIAGSTYWESNLTNYQVELKLYNTTGTSAGNTIYLGSGLQTDWDDIRFTDTSDNLLDFYTEEKGTNYAIVWAEVSSLNKFGTTDIYLYSKNASATSVSSSTNTFKYFTDFTNLDGWTVGGGTVSGSIVNLTGIGSIVYTTPGFFYNERIIFKANIDATSTEPVDYPSFAGICSDPYHTQNPYGFTKNSGSGNIHYVHNAYSDSLGYAGGTWKRYYIDYMYPTEYDQKVRVLVNSTIVGTDESPIGDIDHIEFQGGDAGTNFIDYAGIVQTNYYEPTITIGDRSAGQTADFTGTPTTVFPGQTVTFTDTSTGTPTSWYWDTNGDGAIENTTRNCSYTYTLPGNYGISLIAGKSGSNTTTTKAAYIQVSPSPVVSDFTANTTNGAAPMVVQFTSTSTNATSYKWDFENDGVIDSYLQNPTHTYPSVGWWSVKLTAESTYSNHTTTKYDYIYVQTSGSSNASSGYGGNYPPKEVSFRVQSLLGNPEPDVVVTASGVETTTGSWDWLSQLLGVKLVETPIQNSTMHGTTDSNGQITFLMIQSVKYNMTFEKSGKISSQVYITPQDSVYTIFLNQQAGDSEFYANNYDYNEYITVNISTSVYNSTANFVKVDYIDLLKQTTSAKIYINQSAGIGNETNIYYNTLVLSDSANFSQSVLLGNTPGQSYIVKVITQNTIFGEQFKYYAISFPNVPKTGLPSNIICYFAIFLLFFVGMFFGQSSAAQGALISCFLGWIFYSIGWLVDLGLAAPAALTLATIVSIFGLIAKRKNSED